MALDTSVPLILCIRSIPLSHLFFLENTSQVSVPLSISTARSWSKPRSFLTWTTAAAFLPSRVLLILHFAAREVFLEMPILRDILCLKPFPHVVYRAQRDPARLSSLIALCCKPVWRPRSSTGRAAPHSQDVPCAPLSPLCLARSSQPFWAQTTHLLPSEAFPAPP